MTRAWLLTALLLATACSDPIPNFAYDGTGGRTTIVAPSTSSGGTPVTHTVGVGCSLANAIVGWWPGEGTPNDIVGKADGVWSPGTAPQYRAGKIGEGFVFAGAGFVRAPVTLTGALTIDLWAISTASDEGTYDATFSSGDRATAPYFQIDSDGAGNYRFFAQDSFNIAPIGNAVWQHLAVTYDGSTVTTYLNGKQAASASWKGKQPLSFATLKIGSNRDTSDFFKGTIDEVHIWSRALTAAEIATLAALTGDALCP